MSERNNNTNRDREDTPDIVPVLPDTSVTSPYDDEKKFDDEIGPADAKIEQVAAERDLSEQTPEMRQKIIQYYGRKVEDDHLQPAADVTVILEKILAMSEEDALDIIVNAMEYHRNDPNFPAGLMERLYQLSLGYKGSDMEQDDWSFDLRTEAAMLHYHSPYPEVRSVTDPYDDPTVPVETVRAYVLGMAFMAGSTALNTFFSPRQPAISLGSNVLQLLLAPCGMFLAKVLPDWNLTVPNAVPLLGGSVARFNPGPWTYKEQMLATICFAVASGAGGTYYVYLVQMLPQYLGNDWVDFPYEILLALSVQFFGFGFAGLLRRFVIFPVEALWPKILPTLALNRALILPEKKGEVLNGWRVGRYRYFLYCFGGMFLYFWIPNTLFTGLRLMNWMTWIAPNNFALANITGSYGGMGFNPISTLDWNTAGSGFLTTPFFSTIQQYIARVLSGLIIIGMYWGNYYWSAYMPINSNESFDNTGQKYNVTRIMGDNGYIDVQSYLDYSPPFFSGANVFGQGAWFAWYTLTLTYVCIRKWDRMTKIGAGMWRSLRKGTSIYHGLSDPHTRMISAYPEVPEWWFLCIIVFSFAFGVAALEGWPTNCPWWSLVLLVAVNAVFLVPSAIMAAAANVTLNTGVLFQLLAGVVFAGNPQAQVIMQAYGSNFIAQADNYISDQKMAHYAKVPPRAIFRAQTIAVFLNCFIFIGMLNWMVENFNRGTLCTWENEQRFVCTNAVLFYASAVQYGAFGVKNFFALYPILPWCFLMGAAVGVPWACTQKYGPAFRERCRLTWRESTYNGINKWFFTPLSWLNYFDPAVTWSGALNWTGGNNLTYATNGVYFAFIFMYYIKRRYGAWWEKYNYLTEAGFDVGIAISGLIQTLIFAFSNGGDGISWSWWGNSIATQGLDYQSYIQNSTLLPLPEKGYFGPDPGSYPRTWGGYGSPE